MPNQAEPVAKTQEIPELAADPKHDIPVNEDAAIQTNLLDFGYRLLPYVVLIEAIAMTIILFGLWPFAQGTHLIGWYFFTLVFSSWLRLRSVYLYNNLKKSKTFRVWKGKVLFYTGTLLAGICWGAVGTPMILPGAPVEQMIALICLIGTVSAGAAYYAIVKHSYCFFILPALLPFMIWLIFQKSPYNYLLGGVAAFTVFLLLIAYYNHKIIFKALLLQFRNEKLIQELSDTQMELQERAKTLKNSFALLKATADSVDNGIFALDTKGRITASNEKLLSLWNIPRPHKPDLLSRSDAILKIIKENSHNFDTLESDIRKVKGNKVNSVTNQIKLRNHNHYEYYITQQTIDNQVEGIVISFRDITDKIRMLDYLKYKATHDELTRLPNKALLFDRIKQAIFHAERNHTLFCVLFLDVDDFKHINDTAGHLYGDLLLIEIGRRLSKSVRKTDTVARLSGDEFIIVFNPVKDVNDIPKLAERIMRQFDDTFILKNSSFDVHTSIGVSVYPYDGDDADLLIKNADTAMYQAKKSPSSSYRFYNETLHAGT